MIQNKITANSKLIPIFNFLNSLNIDWFLANGSCLEFVRSGDSVFRKGILDIGIYNPTKEIKQEIQHLPVKRITRYNGEISGITILMNHRINIFFFIDFHKYIIETRHYEAINRYRLLCYDQEIVKDGTEKILFPKGNLQVLKRRRAYCRMLYGNKFFDITEKWDEWNDPANIIWEDFIQRPIRLI